MWQTLTDRLVVNKCANRRLGDEVQNEEINNFYCGMHPLDAFANTADKTIRDWEEKGSSSTTTMSFKKRGCSAAFALIQAMLQGRCRASLGNKNPPADGRYHEKSSSVNNGKSFPCVFSEW